MTSKRVTFDEALDRIRRDADDKQNVSQKGSTVKKTQLGAEFEKLMVHFFKNDTMYGVFKDVKRWYDWFGEPDIGIDIVAEDQEGKLVGMQCKCWQDESSIAENDFTNMYALTKSRDISRTILVFTGEHLTTNAQKVCEENHTTVIMKSDLRQSGIDWDMTPGKVTRARPKKLFPHQKEAVQKTVEGFKSHDRGKLIMACGTGKTLTALHIAERMAGAGGLVLYLVPSISLIPQTMREWADNRSVIHQYLAVCSDRHAGNDEQGSITEIPIRPSTSVHELKRQLRVRDLTKMCVVFSTYNSVAVAAEAMGGGG